MSTTHQFALASLFTRQHRAHDVGNFHAPCHYPPPSLRGLYTLFWNTCPTSQPPPKELHNRQHFLFTLWHAIASLQPRVIFDGLKKAPRLRHYRCTNDSIARPTKNKNRRLRLP